MVNGIRNRLRISFVIWITVMWTLLMGEFSWANLFGGLAVGFFVVLALPLPAMPISNLHINWGALIAFVFRWFWDLAHASAKVAWLALRPQAPPKTAILQVPMRVANELVLYLATCAYNLQPGGSVSDIDIANRTWTIHVLDATTQADIDREIQNVLDLEKRMINIFEKRS
ncbi:Na+/H+ antiporter subunit E [Corynebacterium breve]|uniref:Na+/H+ antiporter subunit E n=1 Tax=Corynebacterium breve TaxID=3049799 RepID=A0ABY8VD60_9CORY|nr:Na+/H+ antiporter subunit E [Corynebacterium breve]WIM67394.1 Na+/H+ antiporter subunit E [Corynebacterium breve]